MKTTTALSPGGEPDSNAREHPFKPKHLDSAAHLPRGPTQESKLIAFRSFQVTGQAIKAAERLPFYCGAMPFRIHRPAATTKGSEIAAAEQRALRRSGRVVGRRQQKWLVRPALTNISCLGVRKLRPTWPSGAKWVKQAPKSQELCSLEQTQYLRRTPRRRHPFSARRPVEDIESPQAQPPRTELARLKGLRRKIETRQ